MRTTFLLPLFCFITLKMQAQPNAWEYLTNISWNKLKANATFYSFPSEDLARQGNRSASLLFLSLDGTWKFQLANNPKDIAVDFFKADFNDKPWYDIRVPGNWEMQGFVHPIYVNWEFPFEPVNPLFIPHDASQDKHRSNRRPVPPDV